jgi:hypothetical protein
MRIHVDLSIWWKHQNYICYCCRYFDRSARTRDLSISLIEVLIEFPPSYTFSDNNENVSSPTMRLSIPHPPLCRKRMARAHGMAVYATVLCYQSFQRLAKVSCSSPAYDLREKAARVWIVSEKRKESILGAVTQNTGRILGAMEGKVSLVCR